MDGVSLVSISHPQEKQSFWKRLKNLFKRKEISEESLEIVEIGYGIEMEKIEPPKKSYRIQKIYDDPVAKLAKQRTFNP